MSGLRESEGTSQTSRPNDSLWTAEIVQKCKIWPGGSLQYVLLKWLSFVKVNYQDVLEGSNRWGYWARVSLLISPLAFLTSWCIYWTVTTVITLEFNRSRHILPTLAPPRRLASRLTELSPIEAHVTLQECSIITWVHENWVNNKKVWRPIHLIRHFSNSSKYLKCPNIPEAKLAPPLRPHYALHGWYLKKKSVTNSKTQGMNFALSITLIPTLSHLQTILNHPHPI